MMFGMLGTIFVNFKDYSYFFALKTFGDKSSLAFCAISKRKVSYNRHFYLR